MDRRGGTSRGRWARRSQVRGELRCALRLLRVGLPVQRACGGARTRLRTGRQNFRDRERNARRSQGGCSGGAKPGSGALREVTRAGPA